ncbi:hypothetical protein LNQ49_18805 [Flavobacterium sp. F-65]|uniref:SatD family (SatD) n=1 Tax=Flavobacterium pisciphilum TaxID=2893755 RepID=A0ABS8MY97_9FLAO|nr:hypothetical protein [Flavobacterium sp. F-65]MCC9073633.1 hypothetical protein [Flavobacterium sp. F-65]
MVSIITGDIIGSRQLQPKDWIDGLKKLFNLFGKNPIEWEIYRGDEFQIEIKNPEDALLSSLLIKAYLRTLKLDARMSIGFGDKTHKAKKISESNGTAFIYSGELFETLKKQKTTLSLKSGNADFDIKLNLMLRLSLTFMDNWLVPAAEFIVIAIQNPTLSQEEIGLKLGINQAAVSRRQKRAQFDLMMDLDRYFRSQIKEFTL